jgi:PPOX class probable F420-dependent enzyme
MADDPRPPAWGPARPAHGGWALVLAVTLLAGGFMVAAGAWALFAPDSFADAVGFARHTHFVHDAGAFQLGIGITLVLGVAWRDGPALALVGLLAANAIHTINHAVDLDLGGHSWDPWGLATLTLLTAIALIVRLRQLGWVIGEVGTAAAPALAPFVRQKTVLLTGYRRDGRPVGTPVSIAVDGDRAVFRSFEKAWKTRRIRNNPIVALTPSTARGTPIGPAIQATARRLDGAEARHAAPASGPQAPAPARPAGAPDPPGWPRQDRPHRPFRTHPLGAGAGGPAAPPHAAVTLITRAGHRAQRNRTSIDDLPALPMTTRA